MEGMFTVVYLVFCAFSTTKSQFVIVRFCSFQISDRRGLCVGRKSAYRAEKMARYVRNAQSTPVEQFRSLSQAAPPWNSRKADLLHELDVYLDSANVSMTSSTPLIPNPLTG